MNYGIIRAMATLARVAGGEEYKRAKFLTDQTIEDGDSEEKVETSLLYMARAMDERREDEEQFVF